MSVDVGRTASCITWVDDTFNPWLSDTRCVGSSAGFAESLEYAAEPGLRTTAEGWEATADDFRRAYQRRRRVLAGPWCWALAPQRQAAAARAFWSLVSATPSVDWLVVCDPLSPDGVTLPPHWGEGYRNVWVGAKLHQASASSALAKLRSLPARLRFVVTKPVLGDVGELDFTGIGWVVVQVAEGTRRADDEWVTSIKLQAMAFGVPTWLDAPGEGGLSHSMQIREEPRPTQ